MDRQAKQFSARFLAIAGVVLGVCLPPPKAMAADAGKCADIPPAGAAGNPFPAVADLRQRLQDWGITFAAQEDTEGWANVTGGAKTGTAYVGLTTAKLAVDLCKLVGWQGAQFFASGYDEQGHGPSHSLVGNQQLVSDLEAAPSLKLFDLYLDQTLLDGKLSLRVGQEGVNDELMITSYGALFMNSSFGFPAMTASILPSGGPNYPLGTPFARIQVKPTEEITVIGALFNGDPAPPGPGDPQVRDRNGTAFRTDGNTLSFAELQYAPASDASPNLPTTYKFGAWYSTSPFADQRFDTAGGLLADPAGTRTARIHHDDWSIYGVVDQRVWSDPDDKDRGIGVFFLAIGGPSDRNLSNVSAEAGISWRGPFADRKNDLLGFGVSYLGVSPATRQFSNDLIAFGRAARGYATNETVFEVTYQAPVTDWFILQPDLQYVVNPNAGIPNSFGSRPEADAFVLGLRVTFRL